MQRLGLLGFMVLELWRRHTLTVTDCHTLTFITSATEGEGGHVFTPVCLFVTCKIEDF